ncbi:MAG: protein-glutamate O-methyltransferase CheR [Fimbriimonadaceae bacterium]|nr:protein-glutamate O-methyltransferase CheR [Fimbriimonadaceae bacterium]
MPSSAEPDSILSELSKQLGLDLLGYDQRLLQPRIARVLKQTHCKTIAELTKWLSGNPARPAEVADLLLVASTEMFRDTQEWGILKSRIFPSLVAQNRFLRVWSAGCSHGAEAFSLAMMLDYSFEGAHQILATDIHSGSLKRAKDGWLIDSVAAKIPDEYRRNYLRREKERWSVSPLIRSTVTFCKLDVLSPFRQSEFDLVACRNVAIYFSADVQRDVYRRLALALRPGGVLFLGRTEIISDPIELNLEHVEGNFYRRITTQASRDGTRLAS